MGTGPGGAGCEGVCAEGKPRYRSVITKVNESLHETKDRRDFLRTAGRYAVAGLLGGGMALLLARHGDECLRPESCRACGQFTGCALPRGVAAKAEKARDERDG